MSLLTAAEIYAEHKKMYYIALDAIKALESNYADFDTIKRARRALDFHEALSNMWGTIHRANLPDDDGGTNDK